MKSTGLPGPAHGTLPAITQFPLVPTICYPLNQTQALSASSNRMDNPPPILPHPTPPHPQEAHPRDKRAPFDRTSTSVFPCKPPRLRHWLDWRQVATPKTAASTPATAKVRFLGHRCIGREVGAERPVRSVRS